MSIGTLISCSDFEDYSTNPNHQLSFSVDTLAFDTVFTTISSATKELMVYNKNNQPLSIESIRLASNSSSGFRINVDGRSGEAFSNIPILGKDSLYIMVEVTVDPTGQNQPVQMEDELEFITNGTKQKVLLMAHGQDANMIKGGLFITKDTTWTADRPYLVYDSIVVAEGARLTLEQGTSFYMYSKAKWIIEGTLEASGSLEAPVLFRGHRLDNFSENIPYDRLSGQWDGIYFASSSFDNVMDHTIVRNGNHGLSFAASTPDRSKLKISNSQVTNMDSKLFHAVNCHIEAVNTEFSNSRDATVLLEGGEYHFIHCTLANYYRFTPGRIYQSMLILRNYMLEIKEEEEEKTPFPLKKATFDNCLIDGTASVGSKDAPQAGELTIEEEEGVELNYHFNHCVIKTKEETNEHFVHVAFIPNDVNSAKKPQYKSIGDSENYHLFDFRLDITKDKDDNPVADQVAIGKADPSFAEKYPLDRLGIDRLNSADGPDIGACEYVPDPEEDDK